MSTEPFDQSRPVTSTSGDYTGTTGRTDDFGASTYATGTEATYGTGTTDSATDVAKGEAASVASDAKASTQQVASTAKDEAQQVAQQAGSQLKDLFDQLRSELSGQGGDQKGRAAGGLRTLAEDLGGMAQHSSSGFGGDLAQRAAGRTQDLADYLETREPAELIEDVKRFARRRPGAFLAAAGIVGLLAGRATRGVVAEKQDEKQYDEVYTQQRTVYQPATTTTVQAVEPVSTVEATPRPYDAGSEYGTSEYGTTGYQTATDYGTTTGTQYGTSAGTAGEGTLPGGGLDR